MGSTGVVGSGVGGVGGSGVVGGAASSVRIESRSSSSSFGSVTWTLPPAAIHCKRAAAVRWDWRYLVGAVGLWAAHAMVGGFGAGCLWELMNLVSFGQGQRGETVSFPVSEVRDVRIGAGWARRGMWLLLLPYFKGIDAMAEGLAVAFVAPDGTPSGGVYALHMHTPEEAQTLAGLLWAEQAPIPGDG